MPQAFTNLYVQPNDLFDALSVEGVNLRLDDHNLATGQAITATGLAPAGSTSISVMPLSYPLPAGTTLQFDGGGDSAVVQAVLSAPANVGATALAVLPLSSSINAQSIAQDDGVNTATAQRLIVACKTATAQVQLYCLGRYDDSQLVQSNIVQMWARALGCKWLCRRRTQAAPKGVLADAEDAIEEMKLVRRGQLNIEDVGTRTSSWPFITNSFVDQTYDYLKVRVITPLSEQTPTQYPQYVDYNSLYLWEF